MYGQRVAADGSLVGGPSRLSAMTEPNDPYMGALCATVVFNPGANEYLLGFAGMTGKWPKDHTRYCGIELYFQRVSSAGVPVGETASVREWMLVHHHYLTGRRAGDRPQRRLERLPRRMESPRLERMAPSPHRSRDPRVPRDGRGNRLPGAVGGRWWHRVRVLGGLEWLRWGLRAPRGRRNAARPRHDRRHRRNGATLRNLRQRLG